MLLSFLCLGHEPECPGSVVECSGTRLSSQEKVETKVTYRARLALLCSISSHLALPLCCPPTFSSLIDTLEESEGRNFNQHFSVLPLSVLPPLLLLGASPYVCKEMVFPPDSTRIANTSQLTSFQLAAMVVIVFLPPCIQHTSVQQNWWYAIKPKISVTL